MDHIKIKFALLLFAISINNYAQLGFCNGSKGEPIFNENFGNGVTFGPALPAGVTSYPFISGAPNDGFYTLYYQSNLYSTWHTSLDHTPDSTNGPNGKMLIVNANAVTSGDFYKKTVSGLCVNTTFEFSAWLMNVYNPGSNFCGAGEIPINVRFEIWNASETILLGSGNTGNIIGTSSPIWQQFALVFTTVSETSVVLKMKNNGLGGCGNDLAIDDISFSACGDLTTVSSPSVTGTTYSTCSNPVSLQLNAATASASPYFYQWQTSTDSTNWTDITGANNATYTTPNLNSLTYFRVKAAQDVANLSNGFCSTASNIFTVSVLQAPTAAVSNGDYIICGNEPIPTLSVTSPAGASVNWYNAATGGSLLQSGNTSFTPSAAGIYYAETYNVSTNCIGSTRTPVALTIIQLPDATITGNTSVCSGSSAVVSFAGTPDSIVTYTINSGGSQNVTLNASGSASITIPSVTSNTTYTLLSCTSPNLNTCSRTIDESVTITVNNLPTASVSSNSQVCSGASATVNFSGTPGAVVTYTVNGGPNQTITLNSVGSSSTTIANVTSVITYALIDVTLNGQCTQSLSQSITISPVALPTASISATPLVVCSGQTSTISFSGTPNAVVTYTIDGGPNQTISLNGSGSASIITAGLTLNHTYMLVSSTLNTCSTIINSAVNVTVINLPTASFSTSASVVCSGNSATINFIGTPGATVTYSTNGGVAQTIFLDASGNASLSTNITSTTTYSLIDVTSAAGCTQALSQSITISLVSSLTASISANPISVCANEISTVDFNGTPNAVVTFAVNGGGNQTVTLNAAGFASLNTNPLSLNTTYQLINVALAGTGCSQPQSGSVAISVLPMPNVSYNGSLNYCDGDPVAIALSSNIPGTIFTWTVNQNNTVGGSAGTGNQIGQGLSLQNEGISGTVTYTVTPVYNGCAGNPVTINVNVHPLPVPEIADGVICLAASAPTSSQYYTLDTNLNAANHNFQWYFQGVLIPNASGSTYNANQIGVYTVIATSGAGCSSVPVAAVVSEMQQGESLVIQQPAAFSDNPTVIVDVVGGEGPFSYQLDDSLFQSSNVFHLVSPGTHIITVIDGYCTHLTTNITIVGYPVYFTPNGDGIHDTWNITGINEAVIRIFDRYGKLVKQISPNGSGWDGTYNGERLPSTDYWFTIDYAENGLSKTFRAHFSLKR
jgi:gliding motility-associated-like protein